MNKFQKKSHTHLLTNYINKIFLYNKIISIHKFSFLEISYQENNIHLKFLKFQRKYYLLIYFFLF